MKRTISLLLAAARGLGLLSGCAQASAAKELTAEPIKLTDADMMAHALEVQTVHAALTDFGLDLLQKSRDKEKKATLVSPLSVALALSMTANGAEGDTLAQFQEVLGDGASIEAINVACRALTVVYRLSRAGGFHPVLHRQQPVGGPGRADQGRLYRHVPGSI